ncbi:MAG: hypothetical protein ACXVEJ_11230 [Nocardioides sp.]
MSSPAVQFRSRMPRIAEAAVERARLTVVPRRRVRAPRMPFVALVSLVLLGGVVGLLLFNTSMQQASFATTALEGQASTLSARELTLKMDLDQLRAPQRVADQARRMGMVLPHNPLFLDLQTGKVTGARFVSTPADGQRIWQLPPSKPSVLTPAPTYVDPPAGSSTDSSTGASGASGHAARGTNDSGHNGTTGTTRHSHQSHQTSTPSHR